MSDEKPTVTVPRELLEKLQAAINPLSGFLRKKGSKAEGYLDRLRAEVREALK